MTKAQKISLVVIITVFLFLIIAIAAFIGSGKIQPTGEAGNSLAEFFGLKKEEVSSGTASEETRKLIEEAQKLAAETENRRQSGEVVNTAKYGQVVSIPGIETESASGTEEEIGKAIVVAPGSNMISMETGDVLNDDGLKADNSLDPADPRSPRQSFPIEDLSLLPPSTVRMTILEGKIEPANFKVKAGQAVSIAVTSKSVYGDIFRFESEKLKGVSIGVGGNETRSITFNAPETIGEYYYFSDVRRQKENGAVGVMIVE